MFLISTAPFRCTVSRIFSDEASFNKFAAYGEGILALLLSKKPQAFALAKTEIERLEKDYKNNSALLLEAKLAKGLLDPKNPQWKEEVIRCIASRDEFVPELFLVIDRTDEEFIRRLVEVLIPISPHRISPRPIANAGNAIAYLGRPALPTFRAILKKLPADYRTNLLLSYLSCNAASEFIPLFRNELESIVKQSTNIISVTQAASLLMERAP
jgi:hypothetical protein